jgi:hypothetical protein
MSSTIITELRGNVRYYTVYDAKDLVVIATTSEKVAKKFWLDCSRGHTARTLYILSRREPMPKSTPRR